ncbi:nucleic acid-binding protein [Alkalicella caledoniensis]|uniref:Nucleic acid-binding protein n=1 Tax=Alkalicella caledoniensis TaxID=2731377 RepID=A0A7G9W665_ALKCA|nr:nucleic acid-binding protein [Alkalicella caledoniensis]QNO14177.1 nucleic acid-binding protein [Alkalicella caledoniensis]
MRTCHRCDTEMIEDFDVKVEGGAYGIKIAKGTGVFAKRIGKPKVAVCPNCGEISLYIEDVDKLQTAQL